MQHFTDCALRISQNEGAFLAEAVAGRQVPLVGVQIKRLHPDTGDGDFRALEAAPSAGRRDRRPDEMLPAGKAAQHRSGLGQIARLPQRRLVDLDEGVAGQNEGVRFLDGHGIGFASGKIGNKIAGWPEGDHSLFVVGLTDFEGDPEKSKQIPATGRRRRQD